MMLCFLKMGNKTVAITIDVMPLKNKSKVEIMISFEFAEVAVRKSSENSTGPCKNWQTVIPVTKMSKNNSPTSLPVFLFDFIF